MATPSVVCLSGLDPTGGAGLQADIEACAAQGVHALALATALTAQDTVDVAAVDAVPAALLTRQLEVLLSDCQPAAVKIGLLGGGDQIPPLVSILHRLALPVVCDPVLRAGGGSELLDASSAARLLDELLPEVTLLTPNAAEARRLVPEANHPGDCARRLLERGCQAVLITGGDEPGDEVVDTLYRHARPPRSWRRPRLPGRFHGAGCTLAAAVAARLASGDDLAIAVDIALSYAQRTLERARPIGRGRLIPRRLP